MNQVPKGKSIRDNVLAAIESGKVAMRPKWHFVLRGALFVLGTVLAALTLLYVVSFIMFISWRTGVSFAPGFGFRGIGVFLVSLPWLLILLAIVFVALLEILVKHYSFGYRKPLLYSTAAVVLVALAGGFVVAQTPFHRGLFDRAFDNHLPFAGGLYRQYGMMRPFGNLEAGVVTEKIENGYRIRNLRGETVEIAVTPQTEYLSGSNIDVDDNIVVLGERDDGSVKAAAIRIVEGEFPESPPMFRDRR